MRWPWSKPEPDLPPAIVSEVTEYVVTVTPAGKPPIRLVFTEAELHAVIYAGLIASGRLSPQESKP